MFKALRENGAVVLELGKRSWERHAKYAKMRFLQGDVIWTGKALRSKEEKHFVYDGYGMEEAFAYFGACLLVRVGRPGERTVSVTEMEVEPGEFEQDSD